MQIRAQAALFPCISIFEVIAIYTLLTKQKEFMKIPHNSTLDICMYQGGYGSGKTWVGSLLGLLLCRKYPSCTGLVCAKQFTLLKDTTLESYLTHLENLGYKSEKEYKYNKNDRKICLSNGSTIIFRGVENPEKIKSLNLHWIEIEEASQITEGAFRQLLGRLRAKPKEGWHNFRYRLFGHTNPQANKGWIYKKFVTNKQENCRLIIAPSSDNTFLPEHYIKSMQEDYDPEYYRINVLGEHGDYTSGLVVKYFSDSENIRKIPYDCNKTLYLTCDFNVDPMCWVLAHIEDNKIFFFDEIIIENTTTQQTIDEFIRKYPEHKGEIVINGDASGDNRSAQSEFTNYMIMKRSLENYGYKPKFKLKNFNPPILNRIQAFNAKVCNSCGDRNLFIDNRCKKLLYNIYNLSFKEGSSIVNIPSLKQIANEHDLKFLEHPFDAASYLVEYYFPIK